MVGAGEHSEPRYADPSDSAPITPPSLRCRSLVLFLFRTVPPFVDIPRLVPFLADQQDLEEVAVLVGPDADVFVGRRQIGTRIDDGTTLQELDVIGDQHPVRAGIADRS